MFLWELTGWDHILWLQTGNKLWIYFQYSLTLRERERETARETVGVRCLMERIDHAAFLTSVSCDSHSECPLQKVLATKGFKLGPKTNDIFPKNGQKKVLQKFFFSDFFWNFFFRVFYPVTKKLVQIIWLYHWKALLGGVGGVFLFYLFYFMHFC